MCRSHGNGGITDLSPEGRGAQEKGRCRKSQGPVRAAPVGHSKHRGLDPESTWKPVKAFHWKSDGSKS